MCWKRILEYKHLLKGKLVKPNSQPVIPKVLEELCRPSAKRVVKVQLLEVTLLGLLVDRRMGHGLERAASRIFAEVSRERGEALATAVTSSFAIARRIDRMFHDCQIEFRTRARLASG